MGQTKDKIKRQSADDSKKANVPPKPAESNELRMPADKFDEMMRRALGALVPSAETKSKPKPKAGKRNKAARRVGP